MTKIIKPYLPLLSLFCLLACDKWDLEQQNFVQIEITAIDSLAIDSVRISGHIKGLITGQVQDHGFVWSEPEVLPEVFFNEGIVSLGVKNNEEWLSFSDTLKLIPLTTFKFRAFATLDQDAYFYSEPITYQTGTGAIITLGALYESGLEVEFQGRLSGTDKGIFAIRHGFCWTTNHAQPTLSDTCVDLGYRRNDELFRFTLRDLQNESTYYFRAYAILSFDFQLDTVYGKTLYFDEDLNFWARKANLGGGTRVGAVGFSIGQAGFVGLGGYEDQYKKDFWKYNPQTNSWAQMADFEGAGREYAIGFAIGLKGYVGIGKGLTIYQDFWEYDPQGNSWSRKADFGGGPRKSGGGFAIGQKGYIGTGYDGTSNKMDFWEYNPQADYWAQKADFTGGIRASAIGFSIDKRGYIGKGVNGTSNRNDFWEYDPETDSWSSKSDFKGVHRQFAVAFSIGQKGYVGTGFLNKKDFWEYDPKLNEWKQLADFAGTGRHGAVGFSIGKKGYLGLGRYSDGDFWEYDP